MWVSWELAFDLWMPFPLGGISGSWGNGSLRSEIETALDGLRISSTQEQKGYQRLLGIWPDNGGAHCNRLPTAKLGWLNSQRPKFTETLNMLISMVLYLKSKQTSQIIIRLCLSNRLEGWAESSTDRMFATQPWPEFAAQIPHKRGRCSGACLQATEEIPGEQ